MLRPRSALLAVAWVAASAPARAAPAEQPRRALARTETHGLGVSAGVGTPYVTVGAQLSYYVQASGYPLRFAPHAAAGVALLRERGDDQPAATAPATAFGLIGSWGWSHRLTVDAFYAPVSATALSLHGESATVAIEWGPGLAVGYEYMAPGGFFARTEIGAQYMVTAPIFPPKDRIYLAATVVGLGYKLW